MEVLIHSSRGVRLTKATQSEIVEGPRMPAGDWVVVVNFNVFLEGASSIDPPAPGRWGEHTHIGYHVAMRSFVEAISTAGFAYSIAGSDHFIQAASQIGTGYPATLIGRSRLHEEMSFQLRVENDRTVNATAQVGQINWMVWKATFVSA